MSASENVSFWKQKAEVDYISLFVFLWFALNAWMRENFPADSGDRQRVNSLKSDRGPLLDTFTELIRGQNANGALFRTEFGDLHRALVAARIPYHRKIWRKETIGFERCSTDSTNNGQLESILVRKEKIADNASFENDSGFDESHREEIKLDDDLWVEDNPERLFAAYMEIVYQIRCALFHGDLATNSEDIANKRVIRQLYVTLSMVMEDV